MLGNKDISIVILGEFFSLNQTMNVHHDLSIKKLDENKAQTYLHDIPNADVVIINALPQDLDDILISLKPVLKNGAIISDVYPLKTEIEKKISGVMPDHVNYIGLSFLKGKAYITPTDNTDLKALEDLSNALHQYGADVETLTIDHHDGLMLASSIVPHFMQFIYKKFTENKAADITAKIAKCDDQGNDRYPVDFVIFERKAIDDALDEYLADFISMRKSIRRGDKAYLDNFMTL